MTYARRDIMEPEDTAPLRTCPSGKRVYASKKDAVTMRNLRMRNGAEFIREYPCELCKGGWHLTKEAPR